MGCITGIISKSFLVAFNVVVAVAGLITLTLASIVQTTLNGYGDEIPQDAQDVLIGLQTVSSFIICLGALGVVVSCCCGNKLFLYTYFVLGLILVIAILVFAGMGAANINNGEYEKAISEKMSEDISNYDCNANSQLETKMDKIFQENECCGYLSAYDMQYSVNCESTLPASCCAEPTCSYDENLYWTGCYTKLKDDVGEEIQATFNFAIFFGILLFALLTSTCLCVKCTDTMPI